MKNAVYLLSTLGILLLNEVTFSQTPSFGSVSQFGGTSITYGLAIDIDPTGNIYSSGYFSGTADFDPGPGTLSYTSGSPSGNTFVIKTDPLGNLVWAAHFNGSSQNIGLGIEVNSLGEVIITGYFQGTVDFDPGTGSVNLTSAGSADIFVCKLDASGNLVWVKQMGGAGIQQPSSVALDASDNIYTTGVLYSTADFDPGPGIFNLTSTNADDIFVSKLDTDGNFVYAKKMGGTSINKGGKSIDVDASGNVIFTGRFQGTVDFDPGPGVFNLIRPAGGLIAPSFICKLDPSGNLVWAKIWQGETRNERKSLITDASGNIFIAGYFGFAADIDPGPGVLNLTPGGNNDMLVIKLDANGDLVWAKQMVGATGTTSSLAEAIELDQFGNIYTIGFLFGTVDFDPGVGSSTLTSQGSTYEDIFIHKLDPSGNFLWAGQMGGPLSGELGAAIAIDGTQNIYTAGSFGPMCDFDPSSCIVELSANGSRDAFIAKTIQSIQLQPVIAGFTPSVGPIGTPVIISGTDFDPSPSNNVATFNGVNALVTTSNSTSITTSVPVGATTGIISVTIGCLSAASSSNFTVGGAAVPTITNFTPTFGPVGTTVTITGTNFDTTPANNIVFFGAVQATANTATTTQLTVTVPTGATYQPITVNVGGLIAYSAMPFTVTFPGGGTIDACSFDPKIDFTTGSEPYSVALGDLDGDGKADLAVTNFASNSVSVFRNNSTGAGSIGFATKIDFPTSLFPGSVFIGDLDGDGKSDLAVTNFTSNSVSVFRNTSTGAGSIGFATKVDYPTGSGPRSVSINDLDNDGKADLVVANQGSSSNSVSVFRNTSTGAGSISYAAKVDYPSGTAPFFVAVGDLDSDGKMDIAVANSTGNSISVLRNTSTGAGNIGYAAKVDYSTASRPQSLSIGDLDGDGKADLVVANLISNSVSVLMNTSTGAGNISYAAKVDYSTTSTPFSVSIADLDGDGKADLVAANGGSNSVSVFRNTSTGVGNINYSAKVDYTTSSLPISVSVGDLDGDGKADLAVTNDVSNTISVLRNGPVLSVTPTITNFTPTFGPIGTTVTITGTDFSPVPANNIVQFNGTPSVVTVSTATTITTSVPAGATTGTISVTIGCNTATSATSFTISSSCVPAPERAALIALYNATDGANWNDNSNWLSADESTWYGVSLTGCQVTALFLDNNNLTGVLPQEIGDFSSLEYLYLSSNQLSGSIPSQLGNLSSLYELDLGLNQLSGEIPIELGNLNNLQIFSLYSNQLSGSIPIELENLGEVIDIYLHDNQFTGTAPAVGINSMNASNITLNNNRLDGIPDFTTYYSINSVDVATNALTFEYLEPNMGLSSFSYIPQDSVGTGFSQFYVIAQPETLTTSVGGANNLYQWEKDGVDILGANSPDYDIPSFSAADVGKYICKVTNSIVPGLTLYHRSFNLHVAGAIMITIQPMDENVCEDTIGTFTTAATGTSGITYQWQYSVDGVVPFADISDGGGYSDVTTPTISVNTAGNFGEGRYRCRINGDATSEVFTFDEGLFINPIPTAPGTTGASICGSSTLLLSASGSVNGNYRWYDVSTGGVAIAGEINDMYTTPILNATSNYYVSINDGACESARTPVAATVNSTPTKPIITSNITPAGGNVSVCSSNTLIFTTPGGFGSYTWSNGELTQQITITSTGSYSVVVTDANGCNSPSSDAITASIIPAPCSNQSPIIISTSTTIQLAGVASIDLSLLISDPDNNIDPNSLKIISPPNSGAFAQIQNSILTIDYSNTSFVGQDKLTIEICDLLGSCAQQELTIEVVGDLIIHNGVSPNGDLYNEKWIIRNIELFPDTRENKISIYNRWGDIIFEIENYDNDSKVFKGINKNGNEVTSGVYFYRIEFISGRKAIAGYLTVKK